MESCYTRELLIERYYKEKAQKAFRLWDNTGLMEALCLEDKEILSQTLESSILIIINYNFKHPSAKNVIFPLIRRIWYVLKSDSIFTKPRYGVTDYEGWTFDELTEIRLLNIPVNIHYIIRELENGLQKIPKPNNRNPKIDYEAEVCWLVTDNYINKFLMENYKSNYDDVLKKL